MNDTQRETSTTGPGAIGEDLNGLLSRFESWKAGRAKSSAADLGEKRGPQERASGDAAKLSSGVREISYDQALRASRYRRHEDAFSAEPIAAAPLNVGDGRAPIDSRPAKEDLSPRIGRWNDDEDWGLPSRVGRWPEVSFIKAASAVADVPATAPQPGAVSVPSVDPAPAARSVEAPISVPASAVPAAATGAGSSRPASFDVPANRDHRDSFLASDVEEAPDAPRASAPGSRPEAGFAEVLKRASAKTEPASRRSVCLTLQAADGEQARLQESAAKTSLSVAVYLRQCSLGMDDLRAQIEIALSRVRREQQGEGRRQLGSLPGSLRQIGARCWRRLRRSNDGFPGLSIR